MSFSINTDIEVRVEGGAETLVVLTGSDPYDSTVLDRARDQASGLIRAKVGVKYNLPTDLTPYGDVAAFLRELELDLVEEALWGRVRETVPERVKAKAKAARELLDAIAAGTAVLPAGTELPPSADAGTLAAVVGSERVFTRDTMDGVF